MKIIKYMDELAEENLVLRRALEDVLCFLHDAYGKDDYPLTQAEINETAEGWIKMAKKAIKIEKGPRCRQ